MSAFRLTAAQVAQFEEDGFVVVRQLLSPEMVTDLRVGYDAATRGELDVDVWKEQVRPGQILQLGMPNRHIPGWAEHAYLPRIVAVGRQLLGADIDYK